MVNIMLLIEKHLIVFYLIGYIVAYYLLRIAKLSNLEKGWPLVMGCLKAASLSWIIVTGIVIIFIIMCVTWIHDYCARMFSILKSQIKKAAPKEPPKWL